MAPGRTWSSASWLFGWVPGVWAEDTDRPELIDRVREIEAMNVQLLVLIDLPRDLQHEIARIVRYRVPVRARYQLAATLAELNQPVEMDVAGVLV